MNNGNKYKLLRIQKDKNLVITMLVKKPTGNLKTCMHLLVQSKFAWFKKKYRTIIKYYKYIKT